MSVDSATALALLSLVVAVTFGLWNQRTAIRALRLAEKQDQRQEPRLDIYLANSFGFRPEGADHRVLVAAMMIRNPTSIDNTVTDIDLEVVYRTVDKVLVTVQLPHDARLADRIEGIEQQVARLPLRVEAHGAVSVAVFFQIDDEIAMPVDIDEYRLALRDTHDLRSVAYLGIVSEVIHGKAQTTEDG